MRRLRSPVVYGGEVHKAGMPKAARSAGIEAFEKAAMQAILRGAPREEVIAEAEDAAKKVWIAERDGR